ncbi:MAG: peptidase, partial [Limisphaerales bacterium]
MLEIKVAANAEPGERELRLETWRGVSNPLVFYVGQIPEFSREPLPITPKQVLGKEADALRNLPPAPEERISLPCTVNGQIASGKVNRYRFEARRGQKLVMTTLGRQLVPFIADAVPGWFQPVLALYDGNGKELAYKGDYEFKPDPTLLFEVPADGDYILEIHDSLYRGREDFVYRITLGELPFVTSVFPLGGRLGVAVKPELKGWNLDGVTLTTTTDAVGQGIQTVRTKRDGVVSNPIPFARDTLPEALEQESNNTIATAQKVSLPVIINGRIDPPDDRDVFTFVGKSNQVVVAEVLARRLDSPLDSVLKLTDANGRLLAFNDDHENLAAGLKTHQADSYLMARLPADGAYYIHIADAAQQGGAQYGYRLRLSEPRPDFDLRVVPSSLSLRSRSSGSLTVYAQRRDGFAGPITLKLQDPPEGFSATPVTLWPT